MVKYCNHLIMHEKMLLFFSSIFRNISKTADIILIKKIEQNHGVLLSKKVLMTKHRKNYILSDINYIVTMSVS